MAREIEHRVKQAIDRQAGVDSQSIWPSDDGGVITLHGSVRTFAERETAELAAATTAGVTRVRNHILVLPAGD